MGINDILAAIDNMKRVGGRNLRDLGRDPVGALSKIAHNVKEQLSTEEGAKEFMYNSMTPGVGGIIKGKGGNWLTGSVERSLAPLKRGDQRWTAANISPAEIEDIRMFGSPEQVAALEAQLKNKGKHPLDAWIEGPLTKYVKRDMATEGDPVRKLAEQGILHFEPEMTRLQDLTNVRKYAGHEAQPQLSRPESQYWNNMADFNVVPGKVEDLSIGNYPKDAEWLAKADPKSMTYQPMEAGFAERLGLGHLTDELANALNPESGLPRHLQLTPEQMQQMGMEKAVRHVAEINAWRAAQQAEANLAKSQSPAVHLVREYAENNPKGLRWVELKTPATSVEKLTPEEKAIYDSYIADKYSEDKALKEATMRSTRKQLEDQLKYEGDTMGHCVGGYCDDVAGGRSRIFSLRDAKGEPHVTIEVSPQRNYGRMEEGNALGEDYLNELFGAAHKDKELNKLIEYGDSDTPEIIARLQSNHPDVYNKFFNIDEPPSIVQIKGKANKAPKEDYLPFVQDFVKNHPEGGKWGEVGDLHNTGLEKLSDYQEAVQNAARVKHPEQMYFTAEELQPFVDAQFAGPQNFAEGGVVQPKEQVWEQLGTGYILR